MDGFSLVDLLLSLSIGALLSGTLFQSLIGDLQSGQRLTRLLRERQFQQRTLRLIASDVTRADAISPDPQHEQHACSLAGRLPVLHLSTSAGPITYSVGDAPSPIWRGQVLMRCGPAYSLRGELSAGAAQNRVLLDGLASEGLSVEAEAPGVVRLLLRQAFRQRDGTNLPLTQRLSAATASS